MSTVANFSIAFTRWREQLGPISTVLGKKFTGAAWVIQISASVYYNGRKFRVIVALQRAHLAKMPWQNFLLHLASSGTFQRL